jgi:hypothetical protein
VGKSPTRGGLAVPASMAFPLMPTLWLLRRWMVAGWGKRFPSWRQALLGALGLQRSQEALLARINRFIPVPFLTFRVMLPSLQIMHLATQQPCSADTIHTGKRVKDGCEEVLEQTIALLQHQGRLSYGVLQRCF